MEPRGVVDGSGPGKGDIRDLGIMLLRAMQPLPALRLDLILRSCRKIQICYMDALLHGGRSGLYRRGPAQGTASFVKKVSLLSSRCDCHVLTTRPEDESI